jgi:hypothetical protein
MPERSEMDKWMIKMNPNMAAVFDVAYNALEAEKKAMPNSKGIVDAEEQKLILKAKDLAQGKAAAPKTEQPSGENGKLPVAGSYDIGGELPSKTFPLTKYGKITFGGTAKLSVSNANAGDTAAVGGASTKLDPKKGAQTSVAMGVSVGLGDFDLFEGVDVEGVSLKFQKTIDAEKIEISFGVEGSINFKGINKEVKVSGEVTLLSLEIAEGKLAPIQGKFAVGPFSVDTTIKGAKVTGQCTCTATIAPDKEKVAAQVAKKVIVDLIEKEVEKQVEKAAVEQGAKMVAAEVAAQVLSKLGPVMTAFSVGYAAGQILTKYTDAGQTAENTQEGMLGNFNEKFQKAGTAGKVYLAVDNAPRIATTLVVSGVAGTAEGILEVNEKVYRGAYHAIKDQFSQTEVDQEGLHNLEKGMQEMPLSSEEETIRSSGV